MKREIISINKSKCTGCGVCIPRCPEGALQVNDGIEYVKGYNIEDTSNEENKPISCGCTDSKSRHLGGNKMFKNFRMNMLNKEASSPKNKSLDIIKNMNIQNGDVIADVGSGGGYFTFKFSNEVGINGKVYSIDTNQKSLEYINDNLKNQKLNNIHTILVDENGLLIPEKVDTIFLRNVFHHLPEQVEYFKNIKQFLKKDGKIVIIEHKKKGFSFVSIFGHNTPEKVIIDTMNSADYNLYKKLDILPSQSFTIYENK